jgi:hypothetical protein
VSDDVVVYLFVFGPMLLLALAGMRPRRRPRNKRTSLPTPRPDERSSIEQFKRMHQP